MLDRNVDVNQRDKWGIWTPLNLAIMFGRATTVTFLLEHGADIHARSRNGDTPLHFATFKGQQKIVKILLEHGADPSLLNMKGQTPAQVAAQQITQYH